VLRFEKGPIPRGLKALQCQKDGWRDSRRFWDPILRDQHYLCAYCQRRIEPQNERMHVEHWAPQNPANQAGDGSQNLRWSNLLGVCAGTSGKERHCDTAKGNQTLYLHPVEGQGPSPREHLRYWVDGTVASDGRRSSEVQKDIEILGLNARILKRGREELLGFIQQRLGKGQWTVAALEREYKKWMLDSAPRAPEFVEVAGFFFRRWIRAAARR